MNTDSQNIDVELQDWLGTQDDGAELAAVASRISRFAANVVPPVVLDRPLQSLMLPKPKSLPRRRRLLPLALAASLVLGGVGIGLYLGQPPARSELAWADVVSAMQPVEGFHVTVFSDNPGLAQRGEHFDLYYRRPELWRAQGMNYVQFGAGSKAKLYGINQGKFVQPGRALPSFIPSDLADAVKRQSLLDAVVQTLFSPNKPPSGTVVHDPALDEAGIQVFDYGDKTVGVSARIWVLERSRLPIRVQVNDTNLGPVIFATVDYSETRSPDFFDADLFKKNVEAGGPPTAREAYENHFVVDDVAGWYKLARDWRQPSTVLKYSQDPADAPPSGFGSEYMDGAHKVGFGYFNTGPTDKLPFYHANGEKVLSDWPLIFVHERTSKILGTKRLITVYVGSFQKPYLGLGFALVGPNGGSYSTLSSANARIDMTGICAPGELRLYAGQPDEKDDSRFSIPFEANGKKGWIDGVFIGKAHEPPQSGDAQNRDVRLSVRLDAH